MRRRLIIAASILALAVLGRPAAAAGSPALVILAMDRLTVQDLWAENLPHLHRLIAEGAAGLMTTRTQGGLSPEKIYLSIGAGEPLKTGPGAGQAFDTDEMQNGLSARDAYRLQTGREPPWEGIFYLGLAAQLQANMPPIGKPGRLGETLKKAGLRLAVLGNADRPNVPGREAVALLVDEQGLVPAGQVGGSTLAADWQMPGGWRTDYDLLMREYERLAPRTDVCLIVLGDLARIAAAGATLAPERAAASQRAALRRADQFAGRLLASPWPPERVVLLVPSPPLPRAAAGERLTPFVLWGRGIRPGLAISSSTREAGIITPFDITATIAAQFGAADAMPSYGHPIRSTPGDASRLPKYYGELIRNYQERSPVLGAYGYALLILVLAWLVLMTRSPRRPAGTGFVEAGLFGLGLGPAIMLGFGLFLLGPVWMTLILLSAAVALAGLALYRMSGDIRIRMAILGFLTVGLVLTDVMRGSPLLRRSLLGYSPIFGARFYGLGNEYLGVTLGGAILGGTALASLAPRRSKTILAFIFAAVALVIFLPGLGANVGGGISAVLGLGYTYFALTGRRIGWREAGGVACATLVLLAMMAAADLAGIFGYSSHLGQAVDRIIQDGPLSAVLLARNKLAMNLSLMAYTQWTWVLLGFLALFPVALKYPPRWLRGFLPETPLLAAGMRGMIVAAVAGLLVNDSGIVVAATIIIYFSFFLAFRRQWEQAARGGGETK